jgi:hypothetical protein
MDKWYEALYVEEKSDIDIKLLKYHAFEDFHLRMSWSFFEK